MKYRYDIFAYTDRYGQCMARISWTDESGQGKRVYTMPFSSHANILDDVRVIISMIEAGKPPNGVVNEG